MKKSKVILLIISIIGSLIATYMIVNMSEKQKNTMTTELHPVIIATRKIDAGCQIEEDMIQVINVLTQNSFNSYQSKDEVVGKVAQTTIYPEEIISKERAINREPADKKDREYRIKVDSITYGGVTPGSRADILWAGTVSPSNKLIGGIVYENVLVKAVLNEYEQDIYSIQADKYNKGTSVPAIVVLSVSQKQANVLEQLKEYSGKEKAFTLAKYTENSKPLGNQNQFIDIINILGIEQSQTITEGQ